MPFQLAISSYISSNDQQKLMLLLLSILSNSKVQDHTLTIKSLTISKANHLDFSLMALSFNALNRKKHTWLIS